MKTVLTFWLVMVTVLVALGLKLKATDFPIATAYYTVNQTAILAAGNNTNTIYTTNYCESDLYHTWYLTCTTNLNGLQCEIDFSGDSTNFFAWGTLGVSATASATVSSTTNAVFKQGWYRYKFTGTNFNATVVYLGGR